MKKRWVLLCSMVFMLALSSNATVYGGSGNGNGSGLVKTYYIALSDAEVATLQHMREEEKLARDVYLALYDQYAMTIFFNIADSEQRHMDAIKRMMDKYGVKDPALADEGVFSAPELQQLYTDLVAQGSQSPEDALTVGATIEDLDIYDLDLAIAETDNLDLAQVYTNLRKGSENHLRAFVGTLENYGLSYTPQYISQDEFDQILAASNESGTRKGNRGN